MSEYLTIPELEEKLHISRQTLYNWRKQGLPTIKVGGRKVLFDYEEVRKWLKTKQQ